jgi:hypothetical protein
MQVDTNQLTKAHGGIRTHQQVAKELRVLYARTMGLRPGEYSSLSDATVELAWRIPADALRRVHDDLTPHHQQRPQLARATT